MGYHMLPQNKGQMRLSFMLSFHKWNDVPVITDVRKMMKQLVDGRGPKVSSILLHRYSFRRMRDDFLCARSAVSPRRSS